MHQEQGLSSFFTPNTRKMSRVNVIDGTSTRDMLIPLHMIAPNLKNVALSPSGAAMSKHEKFRTPAEKAILDASHINPTYSFH